MHIPVADAFPGGGERAACRREMRGHARGPKSLARKKAAPRRGGAAKDQFARRMAVRLLGVAAAQHLSEGLNLLLPAALLTRLLKITLRASAFDNVLAIELLLHATQRAVDGLVFADFDFDGHLNSREQTNGERKSWLIGLSAARSSIAFLHLLRTV